MRPSSPDHVLGEIPQKNHGCCRSLLGAGNFARIAKATILLAMALLVAATQVCSQANVHGQWQTAPTVMPINPVHASLLRNGKILIVSGSGNYPSNTDFESAVWDPTTSSVTTLPIGWDMFCNDMVALAD